MLSDNWLSAGSHTFDFHFSLPPRLPSTFASKIGHVFYFVQASCMGREHILAKKRMYLLVQGTSDFHKENPLQVVMGEGQRWGLSSKLTRGRREGSEQREPLPGRRKGADGSPGPPEFTKGESLVGPKPAVALNQDNPASPGGMGWYPGTSTVDRTGDRGYWPWRGWGPRVPLNTTPCPGHSPQRMTGPQCP